MEGIRIKNLPDLLQKANERFAEIQKKAEDEKEEAQQRIEKAMKAEARLQRRLKKDQERVEKMKEGYEEIKEKTAARIQEKIGSETYTKEDVKKGKISLKEYYSKAKEREEKHRQKYQELIEETKTLLEAIREKNLEILKTQKEIAYQQRVVLNAQTQPLRLFVEDLKLLEDFVDREAGAYRDEIMSSDSTLKIIKDKLQKCAGHSLSGRISWRNLTRQEANEVIFDPAFPKKYAAELLKELERFPGDDKVNVVCRTKGSDFGEQISVEPAPVPGRIYRTGGHIYEKKNGKIHKRKEW